MQEQTLELVLESTPFACRHGFEFLGDVLPINRVELLLAHCRCLVEAPTVKIGADIDASFAGYPGTLSNSAVSYRQHVFRFCCHSRIL